MLGDGVGPAEGPALGAGGVEAEPPPAGVPPPPGAAPPPPGEPPPPGAAPPPPGPAANAVELHINKNVTNAAGRTFRALST